MLQPTHRHANIEIKVIINFDNTPSERRRRSGAVPL